MPLRFDRRFDAPPGLAMALSPLVTRVLAPNPGPFTFRGTGVYLVGASDNKRSVVVIDPGPLLEAHMAALKDAIGGRRVSHILITHTHRDHSQSANALKAWSGAKTYGFHDPLRPSLTTHASMLSATAISPSEALRAEGEDGAVQVEEADDTDFVPDVRLSDGSVVLGDGFRLTALHTPGHAANHLCFALEDEKALFCGDHVMGWSTSVIAPPDGDMADYMDSLERLMARHDAMLYPTHGAPIANPRPYLQALLAHRREREAQILAQLCFARARVAGLVAALYPDLEPRLRGAAALTVTAHLRKLEAEGKVRCEDERWSVTVPPAI
jgi:glyoxylase-like metal-dependent hydrolase (beta-lactamase superfamily II)